MKISIVGGGWVGCHLSYKLMEDHDVTLYENNDELFLETSYKNQNRLHLGYHYARSYATRQLCLETYDRFMNDYGSFTETVPNNYYCVANESIIDFKTYLQIFSEDVNQQFKNKLNLKNVEGYIDTKERYINFQKLHSFFNYQLDGIKVKQKVSDLSKIKSDLVINCTNNHLNPIDNSYYELTLTLLYKKIKTLQFGALTFVDGNFFSIYPYSKDLFTVTDVEHTPIKQFKTIEELQDYKIAPEIIKEKQNLIENKINKYYPEFLNQFAYENYFISTKAKQISYSANRYPIIQHKDNFVTCYTGKIQGIYAIEDYIKTCLEMN